MKLTYKLTAASLVALYSPAAWAQEAPMTPQAGGSTERTGTSPGARPQAEGEDIIVTARRISERALDVPIAITAFSQEDVRRKNI